MLLIVSNMTPPERPILFHYPPSIYSHRVLWYLWLRGIPYDECIQPPVMPRPDLASIDVQYRKIPILVIGKDVYSDSRLIISKLESLYLNSKLAPSTLAEEGIRRLFENYTIDGGIFTNAMKLMPYWTEASLLQNKTFLDDRQKLMGGRRMTKELMEAWRPDGLQHIRQAFDLLENTFLADGRTWILGSAEPTLADIDAVWPFEWMIMDRHMKECLPEGYINENIYPKVFSWVRRFMSVIEKKKLEHAKPTRLTGDDVLKQILNATSSPDATGFNSHDPLDVHQGDLVEAYPSDYGQMGRSVGHLVGLTTDEVVIRNSKGLYLHFPRWNFSIKRKASSSAIRPSTPKVSKKIPSMRLIYHHFSPYSRKVFVLAHELGLAKYITLQKVVVCPVPIEGWSDNNKDVSVFNPMAKIPCLIPENVSDGIYDSNVICEYLEDLASVTRKKDARYWQLHTLHACADGIMDAAVLITYEVRIRKERKLYFDEWMEGQKQKVVRGLDRLEVAAKEGILPTPGPGPASADEVAVAVATSMAGQMGYLGIDWRSGRPKLQDWMAKWEKRRSFIASPPSQDWVANNELKGASKI